MIRTIKGIGNKYIFAGGLYLLTVTCGFPASANAAEISFRHNDKINNYLLKQINDINNNIVNNIANNKAHKMCDLLPVEKKEVFCEPLLKTSQNIAQLLSKYDFKKTNDYHVKYSGKGKKTFSLPSTNHQIYYIQGGFLKHGEKYIITMESSGNLTDYIIIIIYEKYNNIWKLNTIQVQNTSYGGKNIEDWYNNSYILYNNGHYYLAYLNILMTRKIVNSLFIRYNIENKIAELYEKCQNEYNKYKFPLHIKSNSNPVIIDIIPQFIKNEMYPLIKYVTKFDLKNGEIIEHEVHEMLPYINELFPGLSSYGRYLIFRAYNEIPTGPERKYNVYGVVVDVRK